jgi:hypothetical protein
MTPERLLPALGTPMILAYRNRERLFELASGAALGVRHLSRVVAGLVPATSISVDSVPSNSGSRDKRGGDART